MRPVMQRMSQLVRIPDLWTHLPWSLAHAGWHQPHRQHDAAEYLTIFRRFLIPDLTTGGWQRGLLRDAPHSPRCEVTDFGETWPLFIPASISQLASEGISRTTVQRLVTVWHNEASNGAVVFTEAPICLRFS